MEDDDILRATDNRPYGRLMAAVAARIATENLKNSDECQSSSDHIETTGILAESSIHAILVYAAVMIMIAFIAFGIIIYRVAQRQGTNYNKPKLVESADAAAKSAPSEAIMTEIKEIVQKLSLDNHAHAATRRMQVRCKVWMCNCVDLIYCIFSLPMHSG